MSLAQRIEKVSPSLTLEITALAKKMKQQGEPIINFAAGEPDFDTPEYIKKAAIAAIRAGYTKYTPASGLLELKEAIRKKLARDNHLSYSACQIVVTSGAKHALYNILQVLCEKGEEVIFASPYWVSYPEMVSLSGARARIVPTDAQDQFKLQRESLRARINKKTKVLILNSPVNPTGCVYLRKELEALAEVALRHKLYVISDEIYEKLVFDNNKHISIASLDKAIFERTIVVNGVSKAFAMTGWRIGYLASPNQRIIKAVSNLQSHSTSNPCAISQKAALEALSRTNKLELEKMVKNFQLRRDCMLKGLATIAQLSFVKPQGAFYLFCNISKTGLNSISFAQRLLKQAKVAVIPGKAFGRDDYVRLSFATNRQQIQEGVRRIKNWLS